MFTLIGKLHRTGLLTVGGLLRLLEAVMTTGINLMALQIGAGDLLRLHRGHVLVLLGDRSFAFGPVGDVK